MFTDVRTLHDEAERLILAPRAYVTRALLHAMIDAGQIVEMTCQYELCVLETREFTPGSGKARAGLSWDHIIPQEIGGPDTPGNMRIMHFACNSARAANEYSDERRAKISAATILRWEDPEYRAKQTGRVHTLDEKARRAASIPKGDDHWTRMQPEKMLRGEAHPMRRSDRDKSPMYCDCGAGPYQGPFGLSVHKGRSSC